MTKYFTLLILFTLLLFQSCKKDHIERKPAIADIPLSADIMRFAMDTTYTDIPTPCVLQLNTDKTWTLYLQGAKSHGTYRWTPTVTYTAQVKFTILQWTMPTTNTAHASKLKLILETVDKCEFPGIPIFGVNFYSNNYATFLRTAKQ